MADQTNKETQATENTEQTETNQQENENKETGIDSDKVVEKLQKRLGKEQAEKNTYAEQLKAAQTELEKYKNGKGTVEKLSEEDKAKKAQDESKKKIQELETKLQLAETTKQTDQVFKDAGLSVGDDVLGMVVSPDSDKTYANAKALIELVNSTREETRKEFLKGRTPKASGSPVKSVKQAEFNKMTYAEKAQLAKENPENFMKLTGGH